MRNAVDFYEGNVSDEATDNKDSEATDDKEL